MIPTKHDKKSKNHKIDLSAIISQLISGFFCMNGILMEWWYCGWK